VEVKWKLTGKNVKANEADWIAMYEGVHIPPDIDIYASSMMATGKNEGTVKFTAPNHAGLHHFRYYLLDDTEAAVSGAFMITKLDKSNLEDNIHVRDAMLAENEVLRIEGKYVEEYSSEEEDIVVVGTGEKRRKKKKKHDGDDPTHDMTGFHVDEDSVSAGGTTVEKWKADADAEQQQNTENVMHAATNYVKKIPTKKVTALTLTLTLTLTLLTLTLILTLLVTLTLIGRKCEPPQPPKSHKISLRVLVVPPLGVVQRTQMRTEGPQKSLNGVLFEPRRKARVVSLRGGRASRMIPSRTGRREGPGRRMTSLRILAASPSLEARNEDSLSALRPPLGLALLVSLSRQLQGPHAGYRP